MTQKTRFVHVHVEQGLISWVSDCANQREAAASGEHDSKQQATFRKPTHTEIDPTIAGSVSRRNVDSGLFQEPAASRIIRMSTSSTSLATWAIPGR